MSLSWCVVGSSTITTHHDQCFPWIPSNPNRKLYPVFLSKQHPNNTLPRIFAVQHGGELFVKESDDVSDQDSEDRFELRNRNEESKVWVKDLFPFEEGELLGTGHKVGMVERTAKTHHKIPESYLDNLCKNGRIKDAIEVLESFAKSGSKVSADTFMNLLQSCIDTSCIKLGRKLHALMSIVENDDPFVETRLVSMYAKCGSLGDARKVFDGMRERNLFSWSAMIGACCRAQKWKDVLELFLMMVRDGVLPDQFLLPKILEACGNLRDLGATKVIHSMVVRCGFCGSLRVCNSILTVYAKCGKLNWAKSFFDHMENRDTVSWNAIITGYCQKGWIEEANRLFGQMREEGIEPGLVTWNIMIASYNHAGETDIAMELMKKMVSLGIVPDVFTWTSMISGFSHNNQRHQAFDVFKEMLLAGVEPNAVTITSVISVCASLRSINKGMEVHGFTIKIGLINNVLVCNSLVDMYCKCGDLEAAQEVFDMTASKDVYTWNSIIAGYCQAGYCGKACELFMKMQESDVAPNVITWNVMISGYIQNGDEDQAMDLFQRMEKDGKIKRNTASWNTLIAGYLQIGEKDKAFWILRQMQSHGIVPNLVTVLSVLPACGNLVAANKVRELHCSVLRRSLESEVPIMNSLIDTYAKSGNLRYSKTIFDRIQAKDVITWNSMISGYVLHGFSDVVIGLFDLMKKSRLNPSRGTYLSVIYAYGLSGLVDDGKKAFSSMFEDYQIVPGPEHFSAMVDLYGRSGRLGEAMMLVENMPIEPDFSVWDALLTASRINKDIGFSVHALDNMLGLEQRNYLIQRLKIQIDGLVGKSDIDLRMIKLENEYAKEKKHLGRCWIELDNKVYTFLAGDQSQPNLYPWINNLTEKMLSKSSFHDGLCIEEENKEEVGGVHSEKLALGFALIGFPRKSQCIRIVKSLRMCGNCHETIKHVSKLYGCEIFVNDSKCLHRFSDGKCSCKDYW